VDARARADRALARAREQGNRRAQAMHLWVLGFIELSGDDPAAALEHLRPAWQIYDELGYFEPGHRLELADTLEALIAVGELDEAERRLVPWEERARALDRAWAIAITARCRARLLAVRGDLESAFAAFDDALAAHERSVYPFEHARTLLALGATQRRAKQRGAARATLEQALGTFEQLGAPLWADKTRAELARIGGRSRSGGELTESERRIAALVGEGRSNREVAAALFLAEHTVETVLSRVYRKLGIRSRTELANRLARQAGEPPPAKS
jgi:DNA-binding CsgD family transcriptional regulator